MLGGTPRCERCSKAVYHAEQVMGPGRKIYHKVCLKCENCAKRLDQGNLVQHDNLPYCSRCHTLLFGTRDLRHANLIPSSPAAKQTREQDSHPHTHDQELPPPRIAPRPVATPADYYTPPILEEPGSRSVGAGFARGGPGAPPTPPREREVTRVDFRSERPIPVSIRGGSPRGKIGARPGFEDRCRGCEGRVYAAEQVFAIGHKWHRGCLRCTSCRSTVDPSKVSDREGAPWCKNCYAREHGPAGIAR